MNIVITGATKGIGRAIAERFAKAGFELILCSRTHSDLLELKSELETKYRSSCHVFVCDVGDRPSLKSFIINIINNFKCVDVLINNAGVFIPGGILREEEGTLEELFSINLASAYHLTRALMPLLRQSVKAHIFNMCSIASVTAYLNGGSYAMTKHALLGFSQNLREQLKKENIRVTAILPGATWSSSWKGSSIPLERFIPAEDIAELIFTAYSLNAQTVVEEIIVRPLKGDIKEDEL